MYLSKSALLASSTPPNKLSFKEKSEFQSLDHISNSQKIKKIILLG